MVHSKVLVYYYQYEFITLKLKFRVHSLYISIMKIIIKLKLTLSQ